MLEINYKNVLDYYKSNLELNDTAHDLLHVKQVYRRMLRMNKLLSTKINKRLVLLAAFIHDLKCHVNRKKHHLLAVEYIQENREVDPFLSQLNNTEIDTLIDAVLNHRASEGYVPMVGLSGLLYAADKDSPDIVEIVKRSYKHNPNLELVLEHIQDKFSRNGYIKYNELYITYYSVAMLEKLYSDIDTLNIEKIKDIVTS